MVWQQIFVVNYIITCRWWCKQLVADTTFFAFRVWQSGIIIETPDKCWCGITIKTINFQRFHWFNSLKINEYEHYSKTLTFHNISSQLVGNLGFGFHFPTQRIHTQYVNENVVNSREHFSPLACRFALNKIKLELISVYQ